MISQIKVVYEYKFNMSNAAKETDLRLKGKAKAGSRPRRPEFCRRKFGKSFVEALRDKYCEAEDYSCGNFVMVVIQGRPKNAANAELGFLRNVGLTESCICHAGIPSSGLQTLCPNVVDLDLTGNLLDSWEEVLPILSQLPLLKFVNLTRNMLKNNQGYLENWSQPLTSIENLVLNGTRISWPELAILTAHMTHLTELHICNNGYEEIDNVNLEGLHSLHCVRLNNNFISSWQEVWKLSQLPKLKSLILSGNPLQEITYNATASQPPMAIQLESNLPKSVQPESDQPKSVQPESDQPKSVQPESDQPKSVQPKSDQPKSVQPKSDQPKSVHSESDQPKSVQPESDQPKSVQDAWNLCSDIVEDLESEMWKRTDFVNCENRETKGQSDTCGSKVKKAWAEGTDNEGKNNSKTENQEQLEDSIGNQTQIFASPESCEKMLHSVSSDLKEQDIEITDIETGKAVTGSTNLESITESDKNPDMPDHLEVAMEMKSVLTQSQLGDQNANVGESSGSIKVNMTGSEVEQEETDSVLSIDGTSLLHENTNYSDLAITNFFSDNSQKITEQFVADCVPTPEFVTCENRCDTEAIFACPEGDAKIANAPTDSDTLRHNQHSSQGCHTLNKEEKACDVPKLTLKHNVPFSSLETLCVSETKLSSWADLDALTSFPVLHTLRIKDVPLLSSEKQEDRRKCLIACLPNIKILNGSEVIEPGKAERHFLRYCAEMTEAERPARCKQLEKIHGKLKPIKVIDIGFNSCLYAEITVIHNGHIVDTTTVHVVQPVGKLRKYIATQLGLPLRSFKMYHFPSGPLHHFEHYEAPELEELRLDSLPMSRFDFMDGDQIHIEILPDTEEYWTALIKAK